MTRDFEIAATETTQAQFSSLMGYNPSHFSSCGPSCPVEKVNWHEAVAYCNALSAKASLTACYTCSGSGTSVTCKETTATAGKVPPPVRKRSTSTGMERSTKIACLSR